jgi:hypothetical protein
MKASSYALRAAGRRADARLACLPFVETSLAPQSPVGLATERSFDAESLRAPARARRVAKERVWGR